MMDSAASAGGTADASDDAAWASQARESIKAGERIAREQFGPDCDIEWLLRSRAHRFDSLILSAWQRSVGSDPDLHLFAVGGYGRSEMFPQSDVDLLVLVTAAGEPSFGQMKNVERFIALLWDAGLKVGHAVRNVAQMLDAMRDITVFTALLDARVLAASDDAARVFKQTVRDFELWSGSTYYETKLQELRERHIRFGNTSDNLEPNIKEGPGGLRDLQTLGWIAKQVHHVGSLEGLIDIGHSGADEISTLLVQHVIQSRLRFGLGLIAGRREERLRFDYQRELAELLGFQGEGNQAVEEMMQGFYRSAALVRRIGERLLQRFEEELSDDTEYETLPDGRYGLANRYLIARDENWPETGLDIMDMFIAWGERDKVKGLHSQTARAVGENLQMVPDYTVAPAPVKQAFLTILRSERPARTLARMSRLGVLQQFIPAFRGVSGRMQFDLFHAYTVDQHTLSVLRNIEGFAHQLEDARFSIANDVFPALRRPELLYIAGLFHDIAKGRRGDHSELGAVDAREFCTAMGISESQTELVEWLVRHHLLMSTVAQKKDIEDPQVLHDFALQVADRDHLDYLYLLTIADIAATADKLWNDWKDQVLAKTYTRTRLAMRRGLENVSNVHDLARETLGEVAQRLLMDGHDAVAAGTVMAKIPDTLLSRASADQVHWIASAMLAANGELPLVRLRRLRRESRDLEVLVHAKDATGLFAAIVLTLDRLGLEIQQARVLDGNHGDIFDIFVVRPLDARAEIDLEAIQAKLTERLQSDWSDIRPTKRRVPGHLRHFRIKTQIEMQAAPDKPGKYFLSLVCNDRPGLLADLSDCLKRQGIAVHDARIATFGERAEDIFQISGPALSGQPTESTVDALQDALRSCIDGAY